MRRQTALCLTAVVLCSTSGAAQYGGKRRAAAPIAAPVTDIRKVDFLNFTYQSPLCSRELGKQGIGKTVRVQKGEFKNRNAYFSVDDSKIVFGDVTGDGSEDAIVPVECGAIAANFAFTEVDVYTIKDGRAALVAQIGDKDMERDYRHYYPDAESYWGVTGTGLKVANGNIAIDVFTDGPHAAPKYTTTLEYHFTSPGFRVVDKPQRRDSPQ
jgi:hypothetical protein